MELTKGSETSANHNLTPGKYPKEYTQYVKHGESLKSRWKFNLKSDDSDEGISDGGVDRLFCTGIFSHGEKWAKCVWGAVIGCFKAGGSRRTTVCAPSVSVMVSYNKKRLLSHIRAPSEYHRKVTCTENCLLLQNVFTTFQV
jgi:hypothetical protein